MGNEVKSRFKAGDRIVVIGEEEWCHGCHGVVKGVCALPKGMPYYLIGLDESPCAYIRDSWVYENVLDKE